MLIIFLTQEKIIVTREIINMPKNSVIDDVEILQEGNGEQAILMLHWWPDNASLWDNQVDALQGSYRCIRFTLPGFDSKYERRARTLDELVDSTRKSIKSRIPFFLILTPAITFRRFGFDFQGSVN